MWTADVEDNKIFRIQNKNSNINFNTSGSFSSFNGYYYNNYAYPIGSDFTVVPSSDTTGQAAVTGAANIMISSPRYRKWRNNTLDTVSNSSVITLTPGTWIVTGRTSFDPTSSTANGTLRYGFVTKEEIDASNKYLQEAKYYQATSDDVKTTVTRIFVIDSTTTVYFLHVHSAAGDILRTPFASGGANRTYIEAIKVV